MRKFIFDCQLKSGLKYLSPILIFALVLGNLPPQVKADSLQSSYIAQESPQPADSSPTDSSEEDTEEQEGTESDPTSNSDDNTEDVDEDDKATEQEPDSDDPDAVTQPQEAKVEISQDSYQKLVGEWTSKDEEGNLLILTFAADKSLTITQVSADGFKFERPSDHTKYELLEEVKLDSHAGIDLTIAEGQTIQTLLKLEENKLKIILVGQEPGRARPLIWNEGEGVTRNFTKEPDTSLAAESE
jgi:hypothetical protein